MRVTASFLTAACLIAASTIASADRIAAQAPMCDLTKANTSAFVKKSATVLGVSTATGVPVATVSFNAFQSRFGQDYSTVHDWSSYNIVDLVIADKETRPLNFKFILQFKQNGDDYSGAYTGSFWVSPGPARHILCFINTDNPSKYGLKFINPVLSADALEVFAGDHNSMNTTWHWSLSYQGSTASKIEVSSIRLLRQSLDFTGLCDAYGQYTDRNWPTKIVLGSDFQTRYNTEHADLVAHPGPNEMTGTSKLVNPVTTLGKWTVVKYPNGAKFLQHPNGKLFWSLGLNGINDSLPTPIQGRTNYFRSLPSTTGPYASCYSTLNTSMGTKQCYSFRKQNLMVKYGANYAPGWLAILKSRLQSWGINTVGIDTTKSILNSYVPFTMDVDTDSFGTRLKPPMVNWESLPDPYASNFQSWCTSNFKTELASYVGNSNLMGVFVDNEMSWGNMNSTSERYNVALAALAAPSSQPAKTAFVAQLTARYGTITNLNKAWGSSFSSWSALQSSTSWKPSTYNTSIYGDFQNFDTSFSAKYFTQVKSALVAAGLKSLYLGCRFSDYTNETVNACAGSADIISFNVYRYYSDFPWAYYNSLSKPVLISEFGVTMRSWGTFGGPAPMASSIGRATAMQQILNTAIAQPNVVGMLYYCYADQPITGRWSDYENGGFGVTDVTDVPYADSINVLRTFSSNMYTTRAGL